MKKIYICAPETVVVRISADELLNALPINYSKSTNHTFDGSGSGGDEAKRWQDFTEEDEDQIDLVNYKPWED